MDRFHSALEFCGSLGLAERADKGRFGVSRRRLQPFVNALTACGPGNLPPEWLADLTANEENYGVALVEALEFGDLVGHLKSRDPVRLKTKLVHVLGGPELPSDESATSNYARNIQFELFLASVLWKAGFAPSLEEHPDVRCQVQNQSFHFECKRLFSVRKLADRIRDASEGLRVSRKTGSDPLARWVIVISLAHILNPGDTIILSPDRSTARVRLRRTLETIASTVRAEWQRYFGSGVAVGVLFHGAATFGIVATGLFERGQDWIGDAYTRPFSAYAPALEELITKTTALATDGDPGIAPITQAHRRQTERARKRRLRARGSAARTLSLIRVRVDSPPRCPTPSRARPWHLPGAEDPHRRSLASWRRQRQCCAGGPRPEPPSSEGATADERSRE